MVRLVFIVIALLATETVAGYHEAFDKGFDEFAKKQGFDDYNDYLAKRDACATMIVNSGNKKIKKQDGKVKFLEVSPPEGHHWMLEDGKYSLMKNPDSGYGQHPNASLIASIPLFPNFLPKVPVLTQSASNSENSSFLEVLPPKGYHWMSNASSYLLMKNPPSGYGAHSAYGYQSSLKLDFAIYSKIKPTSSEKDDYASTARNNVREASAVIYDWLENSNKSGLGELFSNIDKSMWMSSNCSFRMFVETNILTDLLETNLTGSNLHKPNTKLKAPKKDYGYGY